MPLQNQSYATPNYLSSLQDKPKINLFDFSKKKPVINTQPQSLPNSTTLNQIRSKSVIQSNQQAKKPGIVTNVLSNIGTGPKEEKEEEDILQMYLKDPDKDLNSKQELMRALQDEVPPQELITHLQSIGYTGPKESFMQGVASKTKESFIGGLGRIKEAGERVASGELTFPEGAARGVAGVSQSIFSPIAGVLGETLETGLEKVPQDFKDSIAQKAQPTIEDVTQWYNNQSPEQQKNLANIGVGVEVLAEWAGLGTSKRVGQQVIKKTGEGVEAIKNKLPNMEEVRINRATNKVDKGEDILFEAVNPTKQETKAVLRNRVQDLLPYIDNNPLKNSLDKVKGRIDVDNAKALAAMKNYENTTGVKGIVNTGDIVKKLQDKYQEKIGKSFIDSTEAKIAQDLIDTLKGFGKQVKDSDIIKIRRAWDKIEKKNKGFMQSAEATSKGDIIGDANKFFREEIRKSNTEYAKFLKDYSTTKTIGDIIEATIQRKTGQSGGYLRRGLETGARIAGAGSGGLPGYIASEALVQGSKALSSSAFKLTRGKKILQKGNKKVQSNKVKPKIIKNGVDSNGDSLTNNSSNRGVTNIPKKKTQVKKPAILTPKQVNNKKIKDLFGDISSQAKSAQKAEISETIKNLSPKNINTIARQLSSKLGIELSKVKKILNTYLSKYGDKIKDKLGDLADELADKTGARAKFMDDGGIGISGKIDKIPESVIQESPNSRFIIKKEFNPKEVFRGVGGSGEGVGTARYGQGLYTTSNKKLAKQFAGKDGQLLEMDRFDDIPQNPAWFENDMDFGNFLDYDIAKKMGLRSKREVENLYPDLSDLFTDLGYDGIVIGKGKDNEIVKFFK